MSMQIFYYLVMKMYYAENEKIKNMKTMSVACLGIAMLVVVLFSAIFVTVETFHECDGEDCPICEMIHQCENNLRQLGAGSAPYLCTAVLVIFYAVIGVLPDNLFLHITPVSVKVRMND